MLRVKEIMKQIMRKNRKVLELRASLKTLEETRAELLKQLNDIVTSAKEEVRALTDEEQNNFNTIEKQIKDIDVSIEMEKRAIDLSVNKNKNNPAKTEVEERAVEEEKVFADYIRGLRSEDRAEGTNMAAGENGAIIPASIANRIISRIQNICPIFEMATHYNVSGTLTIPLYDEETQSITMAYADEFTELTSTAGKFKNITLTGFLAGALTKISKKLINNSNFELVNFVITKMAEAATKFIEKELLIGTAEKIEGLSKVSNIVTAEAATAVTSDELIDLQEEVIDAYQSNAIWIMSRKTRKAIRKLKDNDGNYLLNRDLNAKWGYTLLGKDVYTSDSMPDMQAGKIAIYYLDPTGLAVKISESLTIEVLRERYADQHVVGVIAWLEMDSKIENVQKVAALKMQA